MNEPLFRVGTMKTELIQQPEAAREAFARHRVLECREALGPDMLEMTMRLLANAIFKPQDVKGLGGREVEEPRRVGRAISLTFQRANMFEWLDRATGCGPLGAVIGRVTQSLAGHDHQLSWHDDWQGRRRRLAITVNLSTEPYEGGLFEIRKKKTREPLFAHRHTEPGTALIFDVARDIEHRVHPISAGGPRRIYAGWFLAPEKTVS